MANPRAPKAYEYENIYPKTKPVRSIHSADLTVKVPGGEEEAMFAVFQGLVNRERPRVYLCHSHGHRFRKGLGADDSLWVDYYEKRFGIGVTRLKDPYDLFDVFGDAVTGAIVYDPKMLDTFNLAVMLSGRQGCLPVTPRLQRDLKKRFAWAGNVVDDLRGRFANGYEVNLWAHKNLQPTCNRNLLVHRIGFGPLIYIYDYVVAHNLFLFHLSHSMKDRKEVALADRIYQSMARPCHVMGWMDDRTTECEYASRTARNGVFITCNGAPNLSLHAGIRCAPRLKPRRLTPAQKRPEKKVYICFVLSDGDALWCLNDFFDGGYNEPERGGVPINWEVQAIHYHLAPGILNYYFESFTDNDLAVASVSGAGYTYPNLHPDQASYFRYSERYMRLTGLHHVFAGHSNPYQATYWQTPRAEVRRTVDMAREHMPSVAGVLAGYSGGGLRQKHFIEPGRTPWVTTTMMIGPKTDLVGDVEKIIATHDNRPLFLAIHAVQTTPPRKLRDAARKLKSKGCEVVLIDEWFAKLSAAAGKGLLADGLYPRGQVTEDGEEAAGAIAHWNRWLRRVFEKVLKKCILPNSKLEKMPPKRFPAIWGSGQPSNETKRTVSTLADDLAYTVIFTGQIMSGFLADYLGADTCELAGIRSAIKSGLKHVKDIDVLAECLTAWLKWEKEPVTVAQAKTWARRMLKLIPRLEKEFSQPPNAR